MKSPTVWITWLQVVLVLLLAYSLVLVFAGSIAGQLFTVLGFGPPESADTELVVLGFPGHALFNVPFAIALGIPLVKLRSMGAPRDTPVR